MTTLPSALFIADPIKDDIALKEAAKLGIPVIAIVDTNCNPEGIDYPIPANDDAVKAIRLISHRIADAIVQGKAEAFSGEEVTDTLAGEDGREQDIDTLGSYTFAPDEPQRLQDLGEPEEPKEPVVAREPEEPKESEGETSTT